MTQLRLQENACRLLTLVGPTGIGKTRLALEVGRSLAESGATLFADGIVFVPLAEVEDHAAMVNALLQAADLAAEGSSSGEEQLLTALRSRQMLFILDNLEHLPAAGTLITTILAAAPNVKILATSCTALRLREEWSHPLHGLSLPPVGDREEMELAVACDAVQLFAERARQVSPTFSLQDQLGDVIRICRLVEGIPLALELAAGWIDVLDARTIADELEQGLDLLEARFCNVPPRQRSMRAGLRRTWSLLDGVEQEALARLALFAGSFTREEAQQVGGASLPVLSSLLEKSLVQPAGPQRYRMPQPLRHFAGGQAEPAR
jgi:predicted ATPase